MRVNKVGGQDALLVSREVSHMVACHFLQNSAFICLCVSNTRSVPANMLVLSLHREATRCSSKALNLVFEVKSPVEFGDQAIGPLCVDTQLQCFFHTGQELSGIREPKRCMQKDLKDSQPLQPGFSG